MGPYISQYSLWLENFFGNFLFLGYSYMDIVFFSGYFGVFYCEVAAKMGLLKTNHQSLVTRGPLWSGVMGAGIGFCGIGLELVWVGGYGRGMRETNGLTRASWSETIIEFEGGLESLIDALKKFRKVEESIGFRIEEILFNAMAFDEEKFKRVEEELNGDDDELREGSPPLRIECSEVIVDYLRREEQINVIFSFKVLRENGVGHDDIVVRINPRLFGPLKREQAFVCELLGENGISMLLALMEAGKNTWNLVGAMRALYSLDRNYDKILLVEELKKLEWMDAVDEK